MLRIEANTVINKAHDLVNSLGHLVGDLIPRGKLLGYIKAPLFLPSEALIDFKVYPGEEVKKNPYWYATDMKTTIYNMLSPLHGSPIVTFEVCQTRGGARLYRPINHLLGLRRSIALNLFSHPNIQQDNSNE